tara:strand:+ start:164 stop:676 length:513 start_codon:yes stop_codon:yes gene_type:complete
MALDDLEKFGDKNQAFNPSDDDGILRIVQNWGNELIAQMQNRLRSNKTNATSSLYESINPQIKGTQRGYRLTVLMEDYWQYVEDGRRAGKMPPIKNIYEWIRYKRPMQDKIQQSPDKIAATKSLAYVIARKIGQKGTKAQPFVTPSLKQVTTQTLAQRIGRYIADTLGSP